MSNETANLLPASPGENTSPTSGISGQEPGEACRQAQGALPDQLQGNPGKEGLVSAGQQGEVVEKAAAVLQEKCGEDPGPDAALRSDAREADTGRSNQAPSVGVVGEANVSGFRLVAEIEAHDVNYKTTADGGISTTFAHSGDWDTALNAGKLGMVRKTSLKILVFVAE